MTKICGIYAIVHRDSGQRYIGASTDIKRRWSEHRSKLKHGRHHTPRLQAAWNSYGPDAFDWEVLEECDAAHLTLCEQINLTRWQPLLLNHYSTPFMPVGTKLSPETRAKMSQARTDQKMTPERRARHRASRQSDAFRQWLAARNVKA